MEDNKALNIKGWKDIQIDLSSPLGMVIDMVNILNQRLVDIEDNIIVDYNGEHISLTEVYRKQAEEEYKKRQEAQSAPKEESKE